MKYKGKQGNSHLFECEGEALELRPSIFGGNLYVYDANRDVILIGSDFKINCEDTPYKDIQTAVSMMQILIEEGEV